MIRCASKFMLVSYGLLTLCNSNHDQGQNDNPDEHAIQFVEPGEDAAESLQPHEQPPGFIAFLAQLLAMLPKVLASSPSYALSMIIGIQRMRLSDAVLSSI